MTQNSFYPPSANGAYKKSALHCTMTKEVLGSLMCTVGCTFIRLF